jgi:starch synthase
MTRSTITRSSDHPIARSVLMVSPEARPFAKTGGLGDVAGALPLALGRLGHHVTLVLPRYRGVQVGDALDRRTIEIGGRTFGVGYFGRLLGPGARAVLVDVPELYDREGLYGIGSRDYPDNAIRFAMLARAALEFGATIEPSLVHAHEWQTGLVPLYLRTRYAGHPVLGGLPVVFTIHNLAFQGLFPPSALPSLDVGSELFAPDGVEFWAKVSFLKAGINWSDRITTVSPRYAREILTPELGFGFDGILARRKRVLSGILNGIDVEEWNPAHDRYLPASFNPVDLAGKLRVKQALLEAFRLPAEAEALETPIIGMVSRLTDQKGFDLVGAAAEELLDVDARFVLLGTGEARYEQLWRRLADEHPDRVGARIGYDESLAHVVVGGADMFLMPSRFEPCGLNQMYSLRYGTVPIVRATGGLDDTVENYSERAATGTGFKFEDYTPQALLRAVRRARRVFDDRKAWRALQLAGMRQDCSWDASAREYVKVYERVLRSRGTRGERGQVRRNGVR